jgi:glycosyltransferase involved in cell wall biosynthesis
VISVVIPAHNEAAVIGRLLSGLLADARPDEFDIVLIANGCTDDTAGVAASFGAPVRVINTPVPSKFQAMRRGDEVAVGFPRLYVDADVELSTAAVRALAAALDEPGVLAVAPQREVVLTDRSRAVRYYYEFWQRLPVVRDGLFARGVIGLSEAAMDRLGTIPDVMGDDLALSVAFTAAERRVVPAAVVRVHAPRVWADLMRRRIRAVTATAEFADRGEGGDSARTTRADLIGVLRREPRMALRLPVFLCVTLLARRRARRAIATNDFSTWLRDESSRT